jgi:hypothetical protein
MYKYQKNIVNKINNFINKNINKIFNYKTKNRKYSNITLIKLIIDSLKDGISFRRIGKQYVNCATIKMNEICIIKKY